MPVDSVEKRLDGKLEQRLGSGWVAEYMESPETGLWRVDLYLRDVPEWVSTDHGTLEEAIRAARDYVNQH